MRKAWLLVLVLMVGVLGIQAQDAPAVRVMASFNVLADVVANVGGERVEVTSIIPDGADPHSFSPSPRDLVTVSEADAVFIVGAGFEEALEDVLDEVVRDGAIIETSDCILILPTTLEAHDEHEGEDHADEEHDDHADEAHDEHEGDDHADESEMATLCQEHLSALSNVVWAEEMQAHALGRLYELDCESHGDHADESDLEHDEHGNCDPHVWTDPRNVMLWVLMIRDSLSAIDPDGAQVYADNAQAYLAELEALVNDEIVPQVETLPAEARVLVTNHATLNYFAVGYGFEVVGTVLPSQNAEPNPSDMANLIDTIRRYEVKAIFAENTLNPSVAEQIASETGATVYALYSDSLSGKEEPASSYLEYVRYNVSTIINALAGE